MFHAPLLYDSTATTTIVHNSIEHFLCNSSDFFSDDVLSCLWIVVTNSAFQVPPQKTVRRVEILGVGWPGVIGLTRNEFVSREVMPEVFKCSVREMRWCLILEWFTSKEFNKLPVSVEKKSWRFPFFCKSYCQRKIGIFLWATLY